MVTVHGNRKLTPLIVTIFFFFAGVGCLVPFLSTHMRDLGLTSWEIVVINASAAFISILGPPIFGVIAEKWHKYRSLLVITLILAGAAYTGLLFIPRVIRNPKTPIMEFDCNVGLRVEKCDNWDTCDDANSLSRNITNFRLHSCSYMCPYVSDVNVSYPLHICFDARNGTMCSVYDTEIEENGTLQFDTRLHAWTAEFWGLENSNTFIVTESNPSAPDFEVCVFRPSSPIYYKNKVFENIRCRPEVTNCSVKCFLQTATTPEGGSEALPCQDIIGDPHLTFWAYLGVRSVGDMALITALCLIDAVTVTSITDFEGGYGKTRVWAALALSIFPPITGVLVDYYSDIARRPDYSPSVFVFDGLVLITCALVIALPLGAARGNKYHNGIYYGRHQKACSGELSVLLINVIILGIQWGFLETFLHLFYVHDVGSSKLIVGITFTVAFACSIPFLCISKNLVRNIGKSNLLVFAFLFYGIRYAGTSVITYPWWSLPFEAMETFSLSVMWIASVAYGQHLIPYGSHLTIQYALNMLHFGVGRGLGTIFGGLMNDTFGIRITMRAIAIFSTVYGLIYLCAHHCYIRPRQKLKKMPQPAVILNGTWYSMAEGRRANGDTHAHQPIIGDQDDGDGPPSMISK